jgi:nucleotide-binding universal stress UspA family protein
MKIILATDGTKYGDAAGDMLGKLNLGSGDSIRILSVVDMAFPLAIDIYGGYLPDTTELEKAASENAAKVIEATKAKLNRFFEGKAVDISSDVLFGSPDSRIVETAEEIGADMIVIGSHGYKQWERLLLGSVSDSVVHHAHCSVLIVRSPAE